MTEHRDLWMPQVWDADAERWEDLRDECVTHTKALNLVGDVRRGGRRSRVVPEEEIDKQRLRDAQIDL